MLERKTRGLDFSLRSHKAYIILVVTKTHVCAQKLSLTHTGWLQRTGTALIDDFVKKAGDKYNKKQS